MRVKVYTIDVDRPRWVPRVPKLAKLGMIVMVLAILPVSVLAHTGSFTDAPHGTPFHDEMNAIKAAGITSGCNVDGTLYCPTESVRRDAMAAFMHRGFGRIGFSQNSGFPTFGGDEADGYVAPTLTSKTITVPGVSGTQFVWLQASAIAFTNGTFASACTQTSNGVCNVELKIYEGGTLLAATFARINDDRGGATLVATGVVAASSGAHTYTLKADSFQVAAGQMFAGSVKFTVVTLPFGATGSTTLDLPPDYDSSIAEGVSR